MLIRTRLYIVAILSMLLPYAASAATSQKGKPQPPVQVVISSSPLPHAPSAIKSGDEVPIRIAVTPSTDATEMRIRCTLSEGVELVSGALEWSGPARKGEEQVITLTVRSPLNGKGKITSRVELYADGAMLISTNTDYDLDRKENKKPHHPVGSRMDKKGQRVDEYR